MANAKVSPKTTFSPDFLVIGVQKAGTTWLHSSLSSCHGITMPKYVKEVNYFNENYHRGLEWYRSQFDEKDCAGGLIGEVSPEYITSKEAITRIHADFPNAKIVVLLRNPPKRTIAHYKHLVRTRNIPHDFDRAVLEHRNIIEWSHYKEQLEFLFSLYSCHNVKIVIFEEMIAHPQAVFEDIGRFIGLPDFQNLVPSSDEKYEFYLPRYRYLYSIARQFSNFLRKCGLQRFVSERKGVFIKLLGKDNNEVPGVSSEQEYGIKSLFLEDIEYVESLLGRDLMAWK